MGVKKGYKQTAEHVKKRMVRRLGTLIKKGPPVSREWLFERYWIRRMDCVQIGAGLGKDPKTIWEWMRKRGVPTRKRGDNYEQLPKGREPGFTLSAEHREALRAARLKDGHVPYLRNGVHWIKSLKPEETPNWRGGTTPERQAFYASVEWKEIVKLVWQRDNATCRRCGKPHNGQRSLGAFHIHHIVTFNYRPLRSEPGNLVLLCRTCHLFVHSRKNTEKDFLGEIPE